MRFPTLRTSRLVLREITMDDVPELFAIHGDPEVMRWFGTESLEDVDGAKRLVELFAGWRRLPNPGTRWGIEVHGEAGLIGTCGLFAWNRSWRKCALGYELAIERQGHGYMREALAAVLDWGFEHMQLNRVEAQIHPDNVASLKLAQSLGFAREGVLREVGHWGGRFHDMVQLSLLRRDWAAAAQAG